MKILYFSFVELDIPNACQAHTLGVLRGFSNNSCKVDAIVPRPKKVRPKIPGVRFYYLWPWRFSALGRFWIKMLGGAYFFTLCLLKKYDAIYVRELEVNPFPRWCSLIFEIPFYIEINAILLREMEIVETHRIRLNRIKKHQALDFKQASGLIIPSFPRCKWIVEYYDLNPDKAHVILNGIDISLAKKVVRSTALKKHNLPQNGLYLGFLGNIWKQYDFNTILKALDICQKEIRELYLVLIGDGPEIESLKKKSERMQKTSSMIFLGNIQPEMLDNVMGMIDIGLMNLTKRGLEDLGPVTTRFATYAAFQIPVIANSTYIENYADEISRGLSLVPPEDSHALADMILRLFNNPEERKEKAKILHDFVIKKQTWNAVTKEILDIINHDEKLKKLGSMEEKHK